MNIKYYVWLMSEVIIFKSLKPWFSIFALRFTIMSGTITKYIEIYICGICFFGVIQVDNTLSNFSN